MKRPSIARSLLLAGFAVLGAWPGIAAAAPKESVTIPPVAEAWYQEVPPCVSLVDCSAIPPATPYPESTLHVAISAGQERARTYLAFSLSQIPSGGELLGGTLTLPLDTDPAHGSMSPDQADMVACLVEADLQPVRGSAGKPPPPSCKVSGPAAYDSESGTFGVDLKPFLEDWNVGEGALALLPSDAAKQAGATWHVTFPATPAGGPAEGPVISATFEYRPPTEEEQKAAFGPPAPGGGAGLTNPLPAVGAQPPIQVTGATGVGGGGVTFPSAPSPAAPPVTPVQPVEVAGEVVPEGFAGEGFAYPQIWALPLVLLAGFSALGRSLTKDLYRRA